jgi:hypothetical protein
MPLTIVDGPIIPQGESLSPLGVDCSAGKIVRITAPFDWTPANLTFQISSDGGGYNDLYYKGREVVVKIGAQWALVVTPEFFEAVAFVKFRSGTAKYPVPQAASRQFAIAVLTP